MRAGTGALEACSCQFIRNSPLASGVQISLRGAIFSEVRAGTGALYSDVVRFEICRFCEFMELRFGVIRMAVVSRVRFVCLERNAKWTVNMWQLTVELSVRCWRKKTFHECDTFSVLFL